MRIDCPFSFGLFAEIGLTCCGLVELHSVLEIMVPRWRLLLRGDWRWLVIFCIFGHLGKRSCRRATGGISYPIRLYMKGVVLPVGGLAICDGRCCRLTGRSSADPANVVVIDEWIQPGVYAVRGGNWPNRSS